MKNSKNETGLQPYSYENHYENLRTVCPSRTVLAWHVQGLALAPACAGAYTDIKTQTTKNPSVLPLTFSVRFSNYSSSCLGYVHVCMYLYRRSLLSVGACRNTFSSYLQPQIVLCLFSLHRPTIKRHRKVFSISEEVNVQRNTFERDTTFV